MIAEPNLDQLRPKLQKAFDFAQEQVENLIETHPDYFPMYTQNGVWKHEGRSLDQLVRGLPRRDDVDSPSPHGRPRLA